jgi:hypothetical protein
MTAQASIGMTYWGVQRFKDIPIPSGQMVGGISGKGLYVHSAGGNFLSTGNLCNWHVEVEFLDRTGRPYDRAVGKTVENCTRVGQQTGLVQRTVQPGRVCVRLYTAFTHRLASVCHHIHR